MKEGSTYMDATLFLYPPPPTGMTDIVPVCAVAKYLNVTRASSAYTGGRTFVYDWQLSVGLLKTLFFFPCVSESMAFLVI